jgi:hypothetical protein
MRWKILVGIVALSLLSGCAAFKGGAGHADEAAGPIRFIKNLFNPDPRTIDAEPPPRPPGAPSPPTIGEIQNRIEESTGHVKDGACWIIQVTAAANDLQPPSNTLISRRVDAYVPPGQYGSEEHDAVEDELRSIAQMIRDARLNTQDDVQALDQACNV